MNALIGIVGDRNPANPTHTATENALRHIPDPVAFEWLPTERIAADGGLARFSGFLVAPGSPYNSMAGALAAIRYARTHDVAMLGTCGGFQHIVLEFVRDVLGDVEAGHAETNPSASHLAVTALACSLAGQNRPVTLIAGSRAAQIYGVASAIEPFFCSFGLNQAYLSAVEAAGLKVEGIGEDGTARIMRLQDHPFFFGTLFVPQARSTPNEPHPLVAAFVAAARAHAG